jgi:enamine deaminase RidA (YjgF/YER057c/UK114 family)
MKNHENFMEGIFFLGMAIVKFGESNSIATNMVAETLTILFTEIMAGPERALPILKTIIETSTCNNDDVIKAVSLLKSMIEKGREEVNKETKKQAEFLFPALTSGRV